VGLVVQVLKMVKSEPHTIFSILRATPKGVVSIATLILMANGTRRAHFPEAQFPTAQIAPEATSEGHFLSRVH